MRLGRKESKTTSLWLEPNFGPGPDLGGPGELGDMAPLTSHHGGLRLETASPTARPVAEMHSPSQRP